MPDTSNENQIRTLMEDWAAAVRSKDMTGALAQHADDIVMFDVPLPLQSRGMDEYRKTWELFFASNRGGPGPVPWCAVLELRQYTLKPGQRDPLIALFDRHFVEPQDAMLT
jgi:hypothetical protein